MTEEIEQHREADPEWDKKFNDFWLPIISTDRQLDVDKIKAEFHDFNFLIENVGKVYSYITANRLSKLMYEADTIIHEHDEVCHEICEEDYKDLETRLNKEIEILEKRLAYHKKKYSSIKNLERNLLKTIKTECSSGDVEANHSKLDKKIIEFLDKAGFHKLAAEFKKLEKWYA